MQDVVSRTPALSFIDLKEVLIFGRFGRPDAEGAFATCHCLTLPESEPGYYFWRDRSTGELTRRSEWFVTKTPVVRVGPTVIKYLISFVLPRFCEQDMTRSWKRELYGTPSRGSPSSIRSCTSSITSIPKPAASVSWPTRTARARDRTVPVSTKKSRRWSAAISRRIRIRPFWTFCGGTFRGSRISSAASSRQRSGTFPSFPQRYVEACTSLPVDTDVKVEPLKPLTQPRLYTEDDLHIRQFTDSSTRRLTRKGQHGPPSPSASAAPHVTTTSAPRAKIPRSTSTARSRCSTRTSPR